MCRSNWLCHSNLLSVDLGLGFKIVLIWIESNQSEPNGQLVAKSNYENPTNPPILDQYDMVDQYSPPLLAVVYFSTSKSCKNITKIDFKN